MTINLSGEGGASARDLQAILPPNSITMTRLLDGDEISWVETVPSGYTMRLISLDAINGGGSHVTDLIAEVEVLVGGNTATANGELKFQPNNPLLEVEGEDQVEFKFINNTGGIIVGSASFRYLYVET